jgi:hypothetical protein
MTISAMAKLFPEPSDVLKKKDIDSFHHAVSKQTIT